MIDRRKFLGTAAIAAAGIALAGCSRPDDGTNPVGRKLTTAEPDDTTGSIDRLPDVELSWLTGGEGKARLASLEGPLVLNVWAQWCSPCRKESPYFQQLYDRGKGRLTVIGLDFADRAEPAMRFIDKLSLRYPHLQDPKGAVKAPFRLGAGLPVTVFVARGGSVVHVARKPYLSVQDLQADVQRYLGVRL